MLSSHGVALLAIGLVGALYALILLLVRHVEPRLAKAIFFLGVTGVVPLAAAWIHVRVLRGGAHMPCGGRFGAATAAVVVAVLLSGIATAVLGWLRGSTAEQWVDGAQRIAKVGVAMHVVAMVGLAVATIRGSAWPDRLLPRRALTMGVLSFALLGTMIVLFRVDLPEASPALRMWSALASADGEGVSLRRALLLSLGVLATAFALHRIEQWVQRAGARRLRLVQRAWLMIGCVVLVAWTFDFSLASDALHYLTNLAPALHLLHGGVLMVDTFSQYGPGPVVATYLGLLLGPRTFGTANVVAQIASALFNVFLLYALYRAAGRRMAAAWLGLFSVQFVFAAWYYGDGNIHAAPSVLGLRYLPVMLLVAAIARLDDDRRASVGTCLAMALAAAWSLEALIGALGVHLGFAVLADARRRDWRRLPSTFAFVAAPVLASVAAVSLATHALSGMWPDHATYLEFMRSYNLVSDYWSYPFDGRFWGWLPLLVGVLVVLSLAWAAVLSGGGELQRHVDERFMRTFLPAALLTIVMAAYFAGRTVDFVVVVAVLPFSIVVIPAAMAIVEAALAGDARSRMPAAGFLSIAVAAWTFSFVHLYRPQAPYSFVLHQCRDLGRCSPAALRLALDEALARRLVIDRGTDRWAHSSYDRKHVVADALHAMAQWAANDARVTLLLGRDDADWSLLSDVALMYAGKWHTWPRSFTFSDELVPTLADRILSARVELPPGAVVIARKDESQLGRLESGILARIRAAGALCAVDARAAQIVVYRFRPDRICSG